jgi:hypothetical protein
MNNNTLPMNPAHMKTQITASTRLDQAIGNLTEELWVRVPRCSKEFDSTHEQLEYIAKTGELAAAIKSLMDARAAVIRLEK